MPEEKTFSRLSMRLELDETFLQKSFILAPVTESFCCIRRQLPVKKWFVFYLSRPDPFDIYKLDASVARGLGCSSRLLYCVVFILFCYLLSYSLLFPRPHGALFYSVRVYYLQPELCVWCRASEKGHGATEERLPYSIEIVWSWNPINTTAQELRDLRRSLRGRGSRSLLSQQD